MGYTRGIVNAVKAERNLLLMKEIRYTLVELTQSQLTQMLVQLSGVTRHYKVDNLH